MVPRLRAKQAGEVKSEDVVMEGTAEEPQSGGDSSSGELSGTGAASSGTRSSTKRWRRKGPSAAKRHRDRGERYQQRMRSKYPDWSFTDRSGGLQEGSLSVLGREREHDYCLRN